MSAYIVFIRDKMKDRAAYDQYIREAAPTLEKYHGEIIVFNGANEALEGAGNGWRGRGSGCGHGGCARRVRQCRVLPIEATPAGCYRRSRRAFRGGRCLSRRRSGHSAVQSGGGSAAWPCRHEASA